LFDDIGDREDVGDIVAGDDGEVPVTLVDGAEDIGEGFGRVRIICGDGDLRRPVVPLIENSSRRLVCLGPLRIVRFYGVQVEVLPERRAARFPGQDQRIAEPDQAGRLDQVDSDRNVFQRHSNQLLSISAFSMNCSSISDRATTRNRTSQPTRRSYSTVKNTSRFWAFVISTTVIPAPR